MFGRGWMDGVEKYAEREGERATRHHFRINYLNSICMCVTDGVDWGWVGWRGALRLCVHSSAFKTDLWFWKDPQLQP